MTPKQLKAALAIAEGKLSLTHPNHPAYVIYQNDIQQIKHLIYFVENGQPWPGR